MRLPCPCMQMIGAMGPLSSHKVGQPGVLFSSDVQLAKKIAQSLKDVQNPIATLSIEALPGASHIEFLDFRVKQSQPLATGEIVVRDKMLCEYLCNYGSVWVRPNFA